MSVCGNPASVIDGIESIDGLEAWLDEYCEGNNKSCWHHYGPANLEAYFEDPLKIIIISAESWGYDWCKRVPRNEYLKWITKKDPTPRYASVIVCAIASAIESLMHGEVPQSYEKSCYQKLYRDDSVILPRMERTGYLNARISSNATGLTHEDRGGINQDIIEYSAYRKKLISLLDPNIVICAGNSAFNSVFGEGRLWSMPAEAKPVYVLDDRLVVRTAHPRRMKDYKKIDTIANQVACNYCELVSGFGTVWQKPDRVER